MKVGILTFHYSTNYGGVIQACSLFRVLRDMGHDVDLIDFVPRGVDISRLSVSNLGLSRADARAPLAIDYAAVVRRLFAYARYHQTVTRKFALYVGSHCRLSERVDETTLPSVLSRYDKVVVGSDQIWNPNQRGRPEYFLDYPSYEGGRISYAADSTTPDVDADERDDLRVALGRFDAISVRNTHSQAFVRNILGQSPVIVSDPTQLVSYGGTESPTRVAGDYILVYRLGREIAGGEEAALREIKSRLRCQVIAIATPNTKFEVSRVVDRVIYDAGPEEWIDYVRNARFVFTDSFHGCLFAIKFSKPFLAYYAEPLRATRFQHLVSAYGIGARVVESVDEIHQKDVLLGSRDVVEVHGQIERDNFRSLEFLRTALST